MDSALTVNGTAADTAVIITPPNRYSCNLTADATAIASGDCSAINGATNIRVMQVLIDRDMGLEIMTPAAHNGLDDLDEVKGRGYATNGAVKFYYDICLKDHIFGPQE